MSARIRLATTGHGAAIADIYRPAVTDSATSFELDPPDGAAMAGRVARILERTPWLVCENGNRVLGYAYAGPHRDRPAYQWSVEVSAYVARDAQRMGVGRALYTSLFAALVVLGYRRAYAGVTLPNPASVALHIAVGFTPVGVFHSIGCKQGAWHDVGWFERALGPPDPSPPLPVPLGALDADSLRDALATGEALLDVRGTG